MRGCDRSGLKGLRGQANGHTVHAIRLKDLSRCFLAVVDPWDVQTIEPVKDRRTARIEAHTQEKRIREHGAHVLVCVCGWNEVYSHGTVSPNGATLRDVAAHITG